MKKIPLIIGVVFMTLFLAGCGSVEPKSEDKITVVTTIPPLYSLASQLVAGSDVEVINLLRPGQSIHDFQLKTSDMTMMSRADLIVVNGLQLEQFLDDIFDDYRLKIVDTSEGIEVLEYDFEHENEGDGHFNEDHGTGNPHIWLSPENAIIQSRNIYEGLVKIDPEGKALYKGNLGKMERNLRKLHAEFESFFGESQIRPFIVFHDAYAYLEREFGFRAAGVLEEFPGREPSAHYLRELIDLIKEKNIEVIFTEPQFSSKLVDTLADDYGLQVFELDPLGKNVTESGYFDMMYANLETFKKAYGKTD